MLLLRHAVFMLCRRTPGDQRAIAVLAVVPMQLALARWRFMRSPRVIAIKTD